MLEEHKKAMIKDTSSSVFASSVLCPPPFHPFLYKSRLEERTHMQRAYAYTGVTNLTVTVKKKKKKEKQQQ